MSASRYTIETLSKEQFPPVLMEIPEPPTQLHLAGNLPQSSSKLLTVVGSRKYSSYGKNACEKIISELAGYTISIVSGLALGIDAIAHTAAMKAGLHTLAVPGSGLDPSVLYPRTHANLAQQIISSGGGLLSEFDNNFGATKWSFPKRNRIMAGMSDAALIIEATERSGTLITARLALDYNRQVFAVPGSIFNSATAGSNTLIKRGAVPITSGADVLEALCIETSDQTPRTYTDCSPDEITVLNNLDQPMTRSALLETVSLEPATVNGLLTTLEIKQHIKESGGTIYRT